MAPIAERVKAMTGLGLLLLGGVLLWSVRRRTGLPVPNPIALWRQTRAVTLQGTAAEAARTAERWLARLPSLHCHFGLINVAVELYVMAGKYEEALRSAQTWSERAQEHGALADPESADLISINQSINQAEALYNLGRVSEARELLEGMDVSRRSPLVRNGWQQQRAWIAMLEGRADEARALMELVDIDNFPAEYRAESHFTWAAIRIHLGELDEAEQQVSRGLEIAVRGSSKRNGIFLLARVAYARGDLEKAVSLFAEGAAVAYRGQGGDSLVLMGDALSKLGRPDEARTAYRLVIERDPQSGAREVAEERLQALAPAGAP